jgi:hypothetical protein
MIGNFTTDDIDIVPTYPKICIQIAPLVLRGIVVEGGTSRS